MAHSIPADKAAGKPKEVADPHPSTEEHYDRQRHPGGAVDPDADAQPDNAEEDRVRDKPSSTSGS